jgi:hypothetical protein
MTIATDRLFDELVAAWDESLSCQTVQTKRPCRNPVAWLALVHHPHPRKLLCTYHLNRWIRQTQRSIARSGAFGCCDCDREFVTIDQFGQFRRV